MKHSTITISINIATGDRYEGNCAIKINVPESELQTVARTLAKDTGTLERVLNSAVRNYTKNNDQNVVAQMPRTFHARWVNGQLTFEN